jgi:hypothetical protein
MNTISRLGGAAQKRSLVKAISKKHCEIANSTLAPWSTGIRSITLSAIKAGDPAPPGGFHGRRATAGLGV